MAEFPPNLDDGELWLPSDIFINDVPSKYNPYGFSCMEDLAGHFAAFSLLKNHPSSAHLRLPPKPPLNSQRVEMAVGDLTANNLPPAFLDFNGGGAELGQRIRGCGNGSIFSRTEPLYELRVQSPQVDSSMETRPRVLQMLQNPIQNRVYPFQGSGFGSRGRVKESGGTGVFHPRILNPATASPAGADVERKQGGVRSRQQEYLVVTQQRNSMRKIINKHEDCYYHLPPEMGLPQDWTY